MKASKSTVAVFLLFIAGCVPSLHPLWTKETLVYDDAIKGSYKESDKVWEFVGDPNDMSYQLTIHEKEGKTSKLKAHLVKIGDQRFFDFYPSEDADLEGGDWLKFHVIPVHLFFHVVQTQPNLVLAAMNPDEVKKLLTEKPDLVKHELIEDDRVVLTDSPQKLQKFVLEGLKVEKFFGEPQELTPISEVEPTQP